MKKSKLFKTISFSSLALLMGIAGTMAFAPLGVSPSVANASETIDQINTKADGENIKYAPSPLGLDPENDPVIYTTESGLEIKYGGATISSGRALGGFMYVTMGTYSSIAVDWVIIGISSADKKTSANLTYPYGLPSTLTSSSGHMKLYFTNNIQDTTTPAGIAVNGEIQNDYLWDTVAATTEIPSGYVLCTTECYLGASRWSNSDGGGSDVWTSSINSRYTSVSGTMTADQKALIKDSKFFGFSYNGSFAVTTYLNTNALRICYNIGTTTAGWWWTNQASSSYKAYAINTSGGIDGSSGEGTIGKDNVSLGIRPCMLLKIT